MEALTIEIHAVGLTTRKAHGEAAEAAFLAKASALGFAVAKPWGESERYDFVVDSGRALWRVQVKSTSRFDGSRYIVKSRGCRTSYTADQIDFIAAYIVPEGAWYVVPISIAAGHSQIYFTPGGSRHSSHEIYREAWCQLSCPRDGPTSIDLARPCETGAGTCKLRQQ